METVRWWTTGEVKTLREHSELGAKKLAQMIPKKSIRSIRSKARNEGISIGWKWNDSRDAALIDCVHDGIYDWGRISELFPGMSKRAVKRRYHRVSGYTTNPGRPMGLKQYDYKYIKKLHDRGTSIQAIAERVGCSTKTVRRAILEEGGNA